jgi:hypothetical protein
MRQSLAVAAATAPASSFSGPGSTAINPPERLYKCTSAGVGTGGDDRFCDYFRRDFSFAEVAIPEAGESDANGVRDVLCGSGRDSRTWKASLRRLSPDANKMGVNCRTRSKMGAP